MRRRVVCRISFFLLSLRCVASECGFYRELTEVGIPVPPWISRHGIDLRLLICLVRRSRSRHVYSVREPVIDLCRGALDSNGRTAERNDDWLRVFHICSPPFCVPSAFSVDRNHL